MTDIKHATQSRPNTRLTVLLVSDVEGPEKTWEDEISTIAALARQDIEEPFNVVIAESDQFEHHQIPHSITETFPDIQFLFTNIASSAKLKDFAVAQCQTEWVAVLDADSAPAPNWLRVLMEAADTHPDYDAFSGRTHYGTETPLLRVLNILDRSVEDPGQDGPTPFPQNNGALYRTEVIKKFPYPDKGTPFLSSGPRAAKMRNAGHKFYHVQAAVVRHQMDTRFIPDFRRNYGFMKMHHRPRTPWAAFLTLAASMKADLVNIVKKHQRYLRWIDWPLIIWMYFRVRPAEIGGLIEYLQGKEKLEGSHFR